jgi:hypothetical protein
MTRVPASFITTHFHDIRWTEWLLSQLRVTTPPAAIAEILVVDQDRTTASAERRDVRADLAETASAGFRPRRPSVHPSGEGSDRPSEAQRRRLGRTCDLSRPNHCRSGDARCTRWQRERRPGSSLVGAGLGTGFSQYHVDERIAAAEPVDRRGPVER